MRENESFNKRFPVGKETSGGDTPVLRDVSQVEPFHQRSCSLRGEKLNVMVTTSKLD